jgi:hypothetical protein
MNSWTLESGAAVADLLGEFHYFQDGYAANLEPCPSLEESQNIPEKISFELGYVRSGGFYAGEERIIRRASFFSREIIKWLRSHEFCNYQFDDHCIEGVRLDEAKAYISLNIDENVLLECRSLTVKAMDDVVRINQPRLGHRDVSIEIMGCPSPSPRAWVEWFEEVGMTVSWRMLGGPAVPATSVPEGMYDGWFLQETSRIAHTKYGLFLRNLSAKENGFKTVFEAFGDDTDVTPKLWESLARVAARFSQNKVVSGNCILVGTEWLSALQGGETFLETIDFEQRMQSQNQT